MNLSNLDFTTVPLVRHSLAVVTLAPPTDGPDFRACPELSPSDTSLSIWACRIVDGVADARIAINIPITATMVAIAANYRPREVLKDVARSVAQLQGHPVEGQYAVGLATGDAPLLFSIDEAGRACLSDSRGDEPSQILKVFELRRQIERLQIEPMSIDKSIPRDFAGTVILRGHGKTATLQDITDSVPHGFEGLLVYSDCNLADIRLRNLPNADIAIANCKGAVDAIFPGELSGSLRITNTDLSSVRLPRSIGGHVVIDGCPTDYATLLPDRIKQSFSLVGRFGESRESLLMTALPMQVGKGMELENVRATMTPFPDHVGGPLIIRNCDLCNARIDTDTSDLQLIESDITRLELGPLALRNLVTTGCYETLRQTVPDLRYAGASSAAATTDRNARPLSPRDIAAIAQPGPHQSRADLDRFAAQASRAHQV